MTIEQLQTYKNTYDCFDGISSDKFENICDELIGYKKLEEQLGCPLEVFVELHNKAHIYDVEGKPLKVLTVLADTVVVKTIQGKREFILLEDYKKSFWLRKNKSR